jgi:hypothetical protein
VGSDKQLVCINEGFMQDIVTKIRTPAYINIVTKLIYARVLILIKLYTIVAPWWSRVVTTHYNLLPLILEVVVGRVTVSITAL